MNPILLAAIIAALLAAAGGGVSPMDAIMPTGL